MLSEDDSELQVPVETLSRVTVTIPAEPSRGPPPPEPRSVTPGPALSSLSAAKLCQCVAPGGRHCQWRPLHSSSQTRPAPGPGRGRSAAGTGRSEGAKLLASAPASASGTRAQAGPGRPSHGDTRSLSECGAKPPVCQSRCADSDAGLRSRWPLHSRVSRRVASVGGSVPLAIGSGELPGYDSAPTMAAGTVTGTASH